MNGNMKLELLRKQLIDEEALRLFPYVDTMGKITIGVGHNLTDRGLSREIVEKILDNDIADAIIDLDKNLNWWRDLDDVRARVIVDLCFNLGISRLLGFRKMNSAFMMGDYATAAYELKNSHWYNQVGLRGPKLVKMILTGMDE